MLEIILLFFLTRKVGDICESKGRSGLPFKIMLVVFWLGGEIFGLILGAVISQGTGALMYVFALAGAAIGAGITFVIVKSLSPVEGYVPSLSNTGYTGLGLNTPSPSDPVQKKNNFN